MSLYWLPAVCSCRLPAASPQCTRAQSSKLLTRLPPSLLPPTRHRFAAQSLGASLSASLLRHDAEEARDAPAYASPKAVLRLLEGLDAEGVSQRSVAGIALLEWARAAATLQQAADAVRRKHAEEEARARAEAEAAEAAAKAAAEAEAAEGEGAEGGEAGEDEQEED